MKTETLAGFAEEFLPEIEELARELEDETVPAEDLVQEGYVGLIETLETLFSGDPDEMPVGMTETVRNAVRGTMEKALRKDKKARSVDDFLVAQVELLDRSIRRLTEELGTKPNIDEIANDMRISQERVLEILKLTGPDISDEALTGGE